ncbi:hypothetical protein HYW21_00245 [Candidatus Woesearchaeota archaeon]|nr:hypothetical protein [Candidatus Woesearchaeota archaeon]
MGWEVLKLMEYENFVKYVTGTRGRGDVTRVNIGTHQGRYVDEISFYYQGDNHPQEFSRMYTYKDNNVVTVKEESIDQSGSCIMFSQNPWSDSMRRSIDGEVMAHFDELMRLRPDLQSIISSALQQIRRS